jgi:hypothetical protein
VLTNSTFDKALCSWHSLSEGEPGIGCSGAVEPHKRVGFIELHPVGTPYPAETFSKDITNVNASKYFTGGGWIEGAHSEFWHAETMHLIASLVEQIRYQ